MKQIRDFDFMELNYLKNTLCKRTGYYFRDKEMLLQIFTLPGFGEPDSGQLHFAGKRVLDFCVSKLFMQYIRQEKMAFSQEQLSDAAANAVREETLAALVEQWEIDRFLIGPTKAVPDASQKATLFQAILGAAAVASDWDNRLLETVVTKMLSDDPILSQLMQQQKGTPRIAMQDALQILDELAGRRECSEPQYSFAKVNHGGREWHMCTCLAITPVTGIVRQVVAPSKVMAQRAAAYLTLCAYYALNNEYGPSETCEKWTFFEGKLLPYTEEKTNRDSKIQEPCPRPVLKFYK